MKYFGAFDFNLFSNSNAARLIRHLFTFLQTNQALFDYNTYYEMRDELTRIARKLFCEGVIMLMTQGHSDNVRNTYTKVRMILLLRALEPEMGLREAKQAIDPLYEIHRVGTK